MKKKNLYSLKFISRAIPLIILMVLIGCASEPPGRVSTAEPAQPTWLTKVPRQRQIGAIPAEPAQPTAKAAAPPVEAKTQEPAKPATAEAQQAAPAKAPVQTIPAEPTKATTPPVEAKAQELAKPATAEAQQAAPAQKPVPVQKPAVTKEEKVFKYLDPKDPRSILYLNSKGQLSGTGDLTKSGPASESVKIGSGWHPEALAAAVLPKDRYGLVDWAKAVKENIIEPMATIESGVQEKPLLDVNVVIETKSDFINNVVFPHYIHTWWLKCEVCHPKIFSDIKGQTQMTMSQIAEGKFCGRCHGKVAFPLTDCSRCHTQPKNASQR